MNDIDKRIAELKGSDGVQFLIDHFEEDLWSTSDAKALELVDELITPQTSRLREFGFTLLHVIRYPLGQRMSAIVQWEAAFYTQMRAETSPENPVKRIAHAEAFTRPKAICQAYVAAREWMAGKGKV